MKLLSDMTCLFRKEQIMKKRLILALVSCAALTMASAAPAFAEDVTLNALFMKQAGYSEEDVTAMTQAFTESTGIQVNPTFVAYEELAPKILTSASSGGYDVILGDCIWPAQFAKAGLVLDVTDRVEALELDDIYQGALDATRYEGRYYGMPWLNDVKYMFVNTELLKQAGIEELPATWDELIEDAKAVKEQGICEYPIAGCYAQAECLICDYTCIAGSFGGAFVDENNQPTLNSEENVAALDFMASTLQDGLCNPKSLEMIEDDVLSTFAAGNAVFAINWTYQYASMNDESQSSVAGQGVIMPIPGTDKAESATVNGGMPLMITAGCGHPDEAWEYMQFLASKEMQAEYCANALPIWKSLYTDEGVIEKAGKEVVAASQIQFDYIVNRPMVPYYNELSTSMQSEIQRVLLGELSAQEALDGLQE